MGAVGGTCSVGPRVGGPVLIRHVGVQRRGRRSGPARSGCRHRPGAADGQQEQRPQAPSCREPHSASSHWAGPETPHLPCDGSPAPSSTQPRRPEQEPVGCALTPDPGSAVPAPHGSTECTFIEKSGEKREKKQEGRG